MANKHTHRHNNKRENDVLWLLIIKGGEIVLIKLCFLCRQSVHLFNKYIYKNLFSALEIIKINFFDWSLINVSYSHRY